MNIAFMSAFRNSVGPQIVRYFRQIDRLAQVAGPNVALHLKLVHGDSQDGTRDALFNCATAMMESERIATFELLERNHGGPVYGSTEEPARMKALSWIANSALESVGPNVDWAVWTESDLLWQPGIILRLIARAISVEADVVAPMVYAGTAFYDIWGFRGLDGARFGPFMPYHPDMVDRDDPVTVSSVGSFVVMKGVVARECRIRNDNALVGFCEDVRTNNYRIVVDPKERVDHP